MKEAYIKQISYYLPEKVITNINLAEEFPEWSAEKINAKIGIQERHVAANDETASDLAVKAAEKLFSQDNVDRNSIDFIILCTQSPDYVLPTSACLIQNRLGLSTKCGAFDINLGCSGFVYALSLAKSLVVSGMAENVLLLTAETYSKYIHQKDKGNRSLFGDGAAATLVSTIGKYRIGNFSFGTDGTGADNLIVRSGGARQPEKLNDLVLNESGNPVCGDNLYMNGTEIFNFTLKAVPELLSDTLSKNELTQEDISYFVLHQANKFMLDFLKKKLRIPNEKFCYCMEKTGNTVSSTVPIALLESEKEGLLSGNIFIAGFGVGYSWAGCILEKVS